MANQEHKRDREHAQLRFLEDGLRSVFMAFWKTITDLFVARPNPGNQRRCWGR